MGSGRVNQQRILDNGGIALARFARTVGMKAAKATARHSVRGAASKARRQPLRSATLLGVGMMAGAAAGWFAARRVA